MSWNQQKIRDEVKAVAIYLSKFAKNPVQEIKNCPDWEWPTLIVLQSVFALVTGLLGAVLNPGLLSFISGALLLPLSAIITTFIGCAFFYYCFIFFFNASIDFRKLFTVIILANLPFLVFHVASTYLPPIDLVGLLFTAALLIVGFVENFHLERKRILRLIAIVYGVFLLVWIANTIHHTTTKTEFRQMATPESLDVLEKELNSQRKTGK